ncbi:MAG: permease [Candidatus Omnitrophica bacterium]|nr:permease [Candidatus Omnitrophota bacterium]
MVILIILTFVALIVSLIADRKRTVMGIKKGLKMFFGVLPMMLNVLILVSVFLYFVPKETLSNLLGKNSGVLGIGIAAALGSVALIPMFITYPLAAILLKSGVSYQVIAVFITTMLMVGVLTLPVEIKYFGLKVGIVRNALSFIGALIIGLVIGIFL